MYDAFFMGVVGKAIDGTERYNGSVAYSVRERAFMAAYDFEGHITDIPDYPEPGVIFKDITTLLKEPEGFKATIDAIADHFKDAGITKVVGAEARGFMIGAPVAYSLGAGFVPARKPGKLPREVRSESLNTEPTASRFIPTRSMKTMWCLLLTTWLPRVARRWRRPTSSGSSVQSLRAWDSSWSSIS